MSVLKKTYVHQGRDVMIHMAAILVYAPMVTKRIKKAVWVCRLFECTDTYGSYSCVCPYGYKEDN